MTITSNRKMKIAALIACMALVVTAGTCAAFAAANKGNTVTNMVSDTEGTRYSADGGQTWLAEDPNADPNFTADETIEVKANEETIVATTNMVSDTEGTRYSADGGQTWSAKDPNADPNFTVDETIEVGAYAETIIDGDIHAPTGEPDVLVNIDDGSTTYSTDGGKTWTDGAPEEVGIDFTVAESNQ
jgi:photosystem II stability/assembly factor-like uncharacterized protein